MGEASGGITDYSFSAQVLGCLLPWNPRDVYFLFGTTSTKIVLFFNRAEILPSQHHS